MGNNLMKPPISAKFPPCNAILRTCMAKTEIIPGIVVKNAPAVGAIKSNRVNLTLEPMSLVKGI